MKTIEIHEFSTGIVLQGTPENWWSARFEGYMNSTLQEIPDAVQHSISNLLFKVAEGKATNNPAIIGREVQEKGDAWSVIAVVTSAKDEKGRAISVYRYFLTQGKGKLSHLLQWYKKAKRPVFNPFDQKQIGQHYIYEIENFSQGYDVFKNPQHKDLLNLLNFYENTILISHDRNLTFHILNELAIRKLARKYFMNLYQQNSQLDLPNIEKFVNLKYVEIDQKIKTELVKKFLKNKFSKNNIHKELAKQFYQFKSNQLTQDQKRGLANDYLFNTKVAEHSRISYLAPYQKESIKSQVANMVLNQEQIETYADEQLSQIYFHKILDNQYQIKNDQVVNFVSWYLRLLTVPEIEEFTKNAIEEQYFENDRLIQDKINEFVQYQINQHEVVNFYLLEILSDQLIAWAYNVEGLTKPRNFQVIYPASVEAQNILEEQLKTEDAGGVITNDPIEMEYPVLKAIRNLASQAKVKSDFINAIEDALRLPGTYTEDVWKNAIFSKLDIENAQDSPVYSPYYFQLDRLYSLILPTQLSSHIIRWLKLLEGENNKLSSLMQEYFDQLESTLDNSLVIQKAFDGINYIIPNLIASSNQENLLMGDEGPTLFSNWLNEDKSGLWGQTYYKFYKGCLWDDIQHVANNYQKIIDKIKEEPKSFERDPYFENCRVLSTDPWKTVAQDLSKLISPDYYQPNKKYLHLAKFFESIDEQEQETTSCRLSAVFYTMALGNVPDELWKKCKFEDNNKHLIGGNFKITRQHTIVQEIISKSIKLLNNVRVWIINIPKNPFPTKSVLFTLLITLFLAEVFLDILDYSPKKWVISSFQSFKKSITASLQSSPQVSPTPELSASPSPILSPNQSPSPKPSVSPKASPSPKPSVSPKASPSPKPSIDPGLEQNVKSLNALVQEFAEVNPGLVSQEDIKNQIVNLLLIDSSIDYIDMVKDQTKLMNKVKIYQENKGIKGKNKDGVISPGGSTYGYLKCDIALNLGIRLQHPPSQCQSNNILENIP